MRVLFRPFSRVLCAACLTAFVLAFSAGEVHSAIDDLPVVRCRKLFTIRSNFHHPSDVTVGPQGRVFVLDGINGKVKVFSSEGTFLSAFGTTGDRKGQFRKPLGIDCDADGTVYVADSGNRRIQAFDPSGAFRFAFSLPRGKDAPPPDPVDVVADRDLNRCYVIDNDNHRVLVYTQDGGSLLDQWGALGEKPGEFHYPFLAAADSMGTLYVVDVLNTRVQALNRDGRTMAFVGKWGVDRGQLYRPKGVAVDTRNRIFVSDSYLGTVQVFKRYRTFLGVLGDEQGGVLRLTSPTGLYVDAAMRIFIVEMTKNRVSVYQILE